MCLPIKLYQFLVSPVIRKCCCFYPSCSQYAIEAIEYHGVIMGLWMSIKRLLRCHPWAQCGYDPVLRGVYEDDFKQASKSNEKY